MRNLLRKLRLMLSLKRYDGVLSIEEALKGYLSKSDLAYIQNRLLDRRRLLEAAAAAGSVSEIDLLKNISKESGIGVLSRVASLGQERGAHLLNLEDFEGVGAIPIMSHGLVVGICCTDPCRLKKVIKEYPGLYISLAPWSLIKKALDESKTAISTNKLQAREHVERELMSAAETCLRLMVSEAEELGSENLQLSLNSSTPTYSLITPDRRIAEGKINQNIAEPLVRLLKKSKSLKISIGEESRQLKLRVWSFANEIKVSWGKSADVVELADRKLLEEDSRGDFILLIDDSETFSLILEKFLEQEGHKVLKANGGHDALRLLDRAEKLPKLIICDLHMPSLDGRELVKQLRSERAYGDIKIVMLTSDDHIDTELSLLASGVDVFLSKSHEPMQLVSKINGLFKQVSSTEAA